MIVSMSLNCTVLLLSVLASEAHDSDALKHAQALEAEHRYSEAVEVYEEFLSENEEEGRARLILGHLYLRRLREPGKAVAHLERACEANPEVCECHFLLSEAYAGRFTSVGVVDKVVLAVKAKSAVDTAVKCDPRSVDYRKARIQYFLTIPPTWAFVESSPIYRAYCAESSSPTTPPISSRSFWKESCFRFSLSEYGGRWASGLRF